MKRLGVIGGMGPASTAYFYELLTRFAGADTDQGHPETLIISRPSIPDRTAFLTGRGADPAPHIIKAGRELAGMGAELIAIPCVTAHCFYDRLAAGISVPVIDMVRQTALRLKDMGVKTAGIMATEGTIRCGVFSGGLNALGIRAVTPPPGVQERVTSLIYNCVKAGRPPDMDAFEAAAGWLAANGSETVVLACTELSLIMRASAAPRGRFVDALECLAVCSLKLCGAAVTEPEALRNQKG
ncbi:MAG: amino acid racemase [Oscillospiraceae bacterium]|nr:amino acid racemase [Oscillospiraceae bacterium]